MGFRYSALAEAQTRGLSGWVRNLPSGEVEALVDGRPEDVERFVAFCHRGPPGASVTRVSVTEEARAAEPLGAFRITQHGAGGDA